MIEVYIDGASAGDPGPSGAGIFIKGHGKAEQYSIPLGMMSNHEAEYHALIKALQLCVEYNYKVVSFRTDSQAVDRSMEKQFAKDDRYSSLVEEALRLADKLDLFFIKWIPSKQNKVADRLARAAIKLNEGV
ncbi:reverse transcriptase-like protein [Sutcliffiella cohnii]|uniref:Ribonuclease HI n=1 Tax=Sutcliffiella cohnii TaxID=33932 RepID=A0A223KQM4_9BACI|nr:MULTISPECIES: reverse transcriptase-like protein [Sutcliffiella]AST91677.1 ribonuclease HI [Sutcliffiella cohnii]MED4014733.1 reverse transcriptase-like protein [Sutcliffiella cohnii]WBL12899.1 reverse transcriptase-like protein [Sutcliffiella sp. NC1]